MSRAIFSGAVVVAGLSAAVLPATPAAANTGSPTPPTARIVICNHSGYTLDVYADGPSVRADDLAGSFHECTDWKPVLPGGYLIGLGLRTASERHVVIHARFKRAGHVYMTFHGQSKVLCSVGNGETLRVDAFIAREH